jgi:acetyl esterase/lipase
MQIQARESVGGTGSISPLNATYELETIKMLFMRRMLVFLFLPCGAVAAQDADEIVGRQPKSISLWPDGAPGSQGKTTPERVSLSPVGSVKVNNVHNPSITPYLPAADKATGAAVILMPGGGHRELNVSSEGYDVGRWLSERGAAAFVLKYRLAREPGSTYRIDVEAFHDAQRAIRLVRRRAPEWAIDPDRVGVLGFSAGGELAAMTAMSYDAVENPVDDVDKQNAKPAFQALIYPGTPGRIKPNAQSPPVFMAVGFNDGTSIGLARIYPLFKEAGVPAELHIYAGAGHPTGFRPKDGTPASKWQERFYEWLDDRGFLSVSEPK